MSNNALLFADGINFQPQQPPQPEAASAPQAEPPQAPTAPAAEPAQPPKKWAGKYETPEELERGYWNSAQETQRILEENKVMKTALQAVSQQQRVSPAERTETRRNFAKELEDAAVPVEALFGLVKEAVREEFAPIMRGAQARNTLSATYGDFKDKEPALQTFLSANPEVEAEYNAMISAGLEKAALDYAYLKFERSNPAPQRIVDASGQEQATARATAALSSAQVGGREVVDQFRQKLDAANKEYAETGNPYAVALALTDLFPIAK